MITEGSIGSIVEFEVKSFDNNDMRNGNETIRGTIIEVAYDDGHWQILIRTKDNKIYKEELHFDETQELVNVKFIKFSKKSFTRPQLMDLEK